MKRIQRIALWFGIVMLSYLVLYFSSVQASFYKSTGPVTPRASYDWPSNSNVAESLFAPAHFIDAILLRRRYWASRRDG